MSAAPYKVIIVVDRNFGEKLAELPSGIPVWIVDTGNNTPIAHRLWSERPSNSHLTGITTFCIVPSSSPEENLIDELGTIDLNHGSYSADPPYSQIEVFGTPLTDTIKASLADYGFDRFAVTSTGFNAIRQIPDKSDTSN